MKTILTFVFAAFLLTSNALSQEFLKTPPRSITFGVTVKDAQELIQGAYVEVLIKDSVVTQNVTDQNGFVKLGVPEYRKQPLFIRVTVAGYKQKEYRNLVAEQDNIYTLVLQAGSGMDVEEAKAREVVATAPMSTTPKSKKQLKKERKEAKKALKKETAYRAELAEIKKELSEVQSTRGRLQGTRKDVEDRAKNGSISESEAQKRIEQINKDINKANEDENKLQEKIKALDKKYGKV